jgi:hypothetical protein
MTTYEAHHENDGPDAKPVFYLSCFFACYISAALVTQVYSGVYPTFDGSPLDYFTGGALWIMSAICLLNAMTRTSQFFNMAFWLAGSAALSVLAIDEFIGLHEATESVFGDDDHIKVAMWAASPVALFLIHRALSAPRAIAWIFAVGWVLHSTYLMIDVGDGDYFSLPVALPTLQWAEDICELLFVSTYLFAFMLMTSDRLRAD